jgi:beta-lactam-binding protein with PASTA domain
MQWATGNWPGQPVWNSESKRYDYSECGGHDANDYPAFKFVEELEFGGFTDWRLPVINKGCGPGVVNELTGYIPGDGCDGTGLFVDGQAYVQLTPVNEPNFSYHLWGSCTHGCCPSEAQGDKYPHEPIGSGPCGCSYSNLQKTDIHYIRAVRDEIVGKPGMLLVLEPNGGEELAAYTAYTITWSSTDAGGDVLIEYSCDGGSTWVPVEPPNVGNSGSYIWIVPILDSDLCLVRVSDALDANVWDVSDAQFSIEIPQNLVQVPDVVRLTQYQAELAITYAAFRVGTVTHAYNDVIEAGSVISQNPAGGAYAWIASFVNLVISDGPSTHQVPDVVGLTQSEAESAITSAGFVAGTITHAYNDVIEAGSVISQNPTGGTYALISSSVNLVISDGPGTRQVPDIVGLTQSEAISTISSADLNVGTITQEYDATVPRGTVTAQDPPAATTVPVNSRVDFVVSFSGEVITIYVDNDAPNDPVPNNPNVSDPNENGFQEHPFDAIQKAIDASVDGDTVIVLPGVYSRWGNHDIDFRGKSIDVRSTDPNDPNVVAATVIDCNVTPEEGHCGFVFYSQEKAESVIDGLTIINVCGTVVSCSPARPTIRRCVFRNQKNGCVISCGDDSNATIIDCRIEYNTATAISCGHSSPTISGCYITNNSASPIIECSSRSNPLIHSCNISYNHCGHRGKVVMPHIDRGDDFAPSSSMRMVNCSIANNWGIGIFMLKSSATIENCKISGNYYTGIEGQSFSFPPPDRPINLTITNSLITDNHVGGIRFDSVPGASTLNLTISNCTIAGNIHLGAIDVGMGSDRFVTITNSIIYNNISNYGSPIFINTPSKITYSDVEGGWPGEGNIDANPMYVKLGYWDPNGTPEDSIAHLWDDIWFDGDYHLLPTSPCIDIGDNNSIPADIADLDGDANTIEPIPFDLDGRARIVDGDCNGTNVVDMGAYEFAHAYMGDFDCDDIVGFLDFAIFASAWLTEPADTQWNPECDISIPPDEYVDILDLAIFCENWLWQAQP